MISRTDWHLAFEGDGKNFKTYTGILMNDFICIHNLYSVYVGDYRIITLTDVKVVITKINWYYKHKECQCGICWERNHIYSGEELPCYTIDGANDFPSPLNMGAKFQIKINFHLEGCLISPLDLTEEDIQYAIRRMLDGWHNPLQASLVVDEVEVLSKPKGCNECLDCSLKV